MNEKHRASTKILKLEWFRLQFRIMRIYRINKSLNLIPLIAFLESQDTTVTHKLFDLWQKLYEVICRFSPDRAFIFDKKTDDKFLWL